MDFPCLEIGNYLLSVDDEMQINAYDTFTGKATELPSNALDRVVGRDIHEAGEYLKGFFLSRKRDRENFCIEEPRGKKICPE